MKNNQIFYLCILLISGLICLACEKSDPEPQLTTSNTGPYVYNTEGMQFIKQQVSDPFLQQEISTLLDKADHFLAQDSYRFVTDKINLPPSGIKNDYMSLHRYTVPDQEGNYVMGDFQVNPQIYDYDRPKLAVFTDAVHTLSLAYFYTHFEPYAAKATELLRAWFFDPETKMNPNLNFAQVNFSDEINKNGIRGGYQGIIDTNDYIHLLEAVSILYDSNSWTPDEHLELKKWFYEFTLWINGKNSLIGTLGPDLHCVENYCNNVGTWADLQKAVYYLFTEQEDLINTSRHIQPISTKLQRQFTPEGRQIYEDRGPLSQHYYYFNLKALVQLMAVRKNRTGYDRDWEYLAKNQLTGFRSALANLSYFIKTGDPQRYFEPDPDFETCRYLEIFRPAAHLFGNTEYESISQHLIDSGCSHPHITLVYPAYEAEADIPPLHP